MFASSENKREKVEEKKVETTAYYIPPPQVDLDDLDDNGHLIIAIEEVNRDLRYGDLRSAVRKLIEDMIIKETKKNPEKALKAAGRFSQEELIVLLREKRLLSPAKTNHAERYDIDEKGELKKQPFSSPTKANHALTYYVDEKGELQLFWIYRGGEKQSLLADGSEIVQHDGSGQWCRLRSIPHTGRLQFLSHSDDTEFKMGEGLPGVMARHRLAKCWSPAKKCYQQEFITDLPRGESLSDILHNLDQCKQQQSTVFLLEMILNMLDNVIALHQRRILHCNLGTKSIIVAGVATSFSDLTKATALPESRKDIEVKATAKAGYRDLLARNNEEGGVIANIKTDIYAVAGIIARCFGMYRSEKDGFQLQSHASRRFMELFPEESDRKAIHDFLRSMRGYQEKRPESVAQVKAGIMKLYQKALKSTVSKACIVDINVLLTMKSDELRRQFIADAQAKYNKFFLVEFAAHSNIEKIEVNRLFEEAHIFCDPVRSLIGIKPEEAPAKLQEITRITDPGKTIKMALFTMDSGPVNKQVLEGAKVKTGKIDVQLDPFARMMGRSKVAPSNPIETPAPAKKSAEKQPVKTGVRHQRSRSH